MPEFFLFANQARAADPNIAPLGTRQATFVNIYLQFGHGRYIGCRQRNVLGRETLRIPNTPFVAHQTRTARPVVAI
jgi:hypothetical protein